MTLDLQEVARVVRAVGDIPPVPVTGWSVDTRTQNSGDLYFALRGPNHDGHDYAGAAVEKGAAGVVVERPAGLPGELVVNDSLRALQDLGAWARARLRLKTPSRTCSPWNCPSGRRSAISTTTSACRCRF